MHCFFSSIAHMGKIKPNLLLFSARRVAQPPCFSPLHKCQEGGLRKIGLWQGPEKSEHWNKKDCEELQEMRCVRVAVRMRSWFNVIFSYIWYWVAEIKASWTMNIEIINTSSRLSSLCTVWSCFYPAQKDEKTLFKISIIYHQAKFVVYVQVYLYTPTGEQKSGSSN